MPPTVKKSRKRATESPERTWSKRRNFNKMRVSAMQATLKVLIADETITSAETTEMRLALQHLTTTLSMWDYRNTNSKQQYLKGGKV